MLATGVVRTSGGMFTYHHIEPGDGTLYEFYVMNSVGYDLHGLVPACVVQGVPFNAYAYHQESVMQFIKDHPTFEYDDEFLMLPSKHAPGGQMIDPFLGYIMGHSNCSVWTAVAAIMAMELHLDHGKIFGS